MPASQSSLVQALVRQDAKQFFLDNCGEIYDAWISLLERTTLPADATSSDQRILDVLVTLDAACREPDHPRSFRLALIQLARVLNSLKEKVKKDRRRGVIAGKRNKVDASVIVDIYCKATGKQRAEAYPLFKAAKRCSALGRDSLLVLTFTDRDAKIIKSTSIPFSKLEAIAEEITRMYPPELIWALDYLSHDGAKRAGSEARLVIVNRILEQAEHSKPKMLLESPRPSTATYRGGSISQQRGEHNNHLSIEGLTHEQPIALDEISVPEDTAVTEDCATRPIATGFGFHASKNNLKLPYSLASYRTNATGWADPNASCGFCEPTVSAVKVQSKRKLFPTVCSCNNKRASYKKLEAIADFIGNDKSHVELVPQAQLVAHARVWALAQQHDILPLMELACQNMVRDLACWTLSMHTFIPILENLIQQIYDNRVTEGQKVRQIVSQFVACVAEDVSALSGWDKLLARFPAFASDYAREVTRRFA